MVSEFNQWREILPSNMAAGLFIERLLGNKQSRMVERIGSINKKKKTLTISSAYAKKRCGLKKGNSAQLMKLISLGGALVFQAGYHPRKRTFQSIGLP